MYLSGEKTGTRSRREIMDEIRSWGVEKGDNSGKVIRKRAVVHSCGHDLSFPARGLVCQQIPRSQERTLYLKKGSCPPLYPRRYFRFLWEESSCLLPDINEGLTDPSSKTLQLPVHQSAPRNVLACYFYHPLYKSTSNWNPCSCVYQHLAVQQAFMKLWSKKHFPSPVNR